MYRGRRSRRRRGGGCPSRIASILPHSRSGDGECHVAGPCVLRRVPAEPVAAAPATRMGLSILGAARRQCRAPKYNAGRPVQHGPNCPARARCHERPSAPHACLQLRGPCVTREYFAPPTEVASPITTPATPRCLPARASGASAPQPVVNLQRLIVGETFTLSGVIPLADFLLPPI